MKISKLIALLQDIEEEFGDLHLTLNTELVQFEPYVDTLHDADLYVIEMGVVDGE